MYLGDYCNVILNLHKMKLLTILIPFLFTFSFLSQKSTLIDKRKKEELMYKTVIIGNAEWMAENLNTSRFLNGDLILEAKTDEEWIEAAANETPAWCFYNNDPLNGVKYGRLYNWYAINDPRGLAPEGWGIPTDCDVWNLIKVLDLTTYYDRSSSFGGMPKNNNSTKNTAGQKIKSIIGWSDDGNGNNNSGFNAKPSGQRVFGVNDGSSWVKPSNGTFGGLNDQSVWWTTSIDDSKLICTKGGDLGYPYYFAVDGQSSSMNLLFDSKGAGCAVRAVKFK